MNECILPVRVQSMNDGVCVWPVLIFAIFSEKHDIQVMVSGAISWWGKTRLVFLDKGLKITGAEYLDTLQHYHIPDCRKLFEGDGFCWQQVLCWSVCFLSSLLPLVVSDMCM